MANSKKKVMPVQGKGISRNMNLTHINDKLKEHYKHCDTLTNFSQSALCKVSFF